jgi:outer membrane receptor protein involved in Fe transport
VSGNIYMGQYKRPNGTSSSYRDNIPSLTNRYLYSQSENKNANNNLHYQVETSYEIDSFNLVSLSMWGYNGRYSSDYWGGTQETDAYGVPVREYASHGSLSGSYGSLSGTIDYQRTFRLPGRIFTLSYKLDNNPGESSNTSWIESMLNYDSRGQYYDNDTWSREQTVQADFVNPIGKKHVLETGLKGILRSNGSDPNTYTWDYDAQQWRYDVRRRNALDYDQYIGALYASYIFKLAKVSAKAGARLETTWNDGVFGFVQEDYTGVKTPFDNTQFNLIPYASFSYAPKSTDRYTVSYTQRLSRPGIWYMNPYVNNSDPLNISTGNPDLDAEVAHSFSANYSYFKSKVSVTVDLNAAITNNSIERVTTVDAQGVSLSKYYNIGHNNNVGLNLFASWRPGAKFSINGNVSGRYVRVEQDNGQGNEGFTLNGNLGTRVALWKNGAMTLNGYYSSPGVRLQGSGSSFFYYGLGLNQKLFKDKVTLNASVSNPLSKYRTWSNTIDTPELYQRSESRYVMRTARLSLSYRFGKSQVQVKKAAKGISNDDVKGGGGSGGGGAEGGGQ